MGSTKVYTMSLFCYCLFMVRVILVLWTDLQSASSWGWTSVSVYLQKLVEMLMRLLSSSLNK